MTPFMIYLWLSLDSINELFVGLTIICIVVLICAPMIYYLDAPSNASKTAKKWIMPTTMAFLVSLLCVTFIPTTKQAAIIFGVPYLINNAKEIHADQLPVKVVDYLNTYLDKEIKEMKK